MTQAEDTKKTISKKAIDSQQKNTPQIGEENLDSILKEIKENRENYTFATQSESPPDKMAPEVCNKIIKDISYEIKGSSQEAVYAITKIVQDGGTNASKKSMVVKVNEKELSLETLRNVITRHDKTGTVRKFAKGIRDIIIEVAKTNQLPGPLFKDIRRNNPEMDFEENWTCWCNEIHSDNYSPECPAQIREALQRREQELRLSIRNKQSPVRNKKRKGRKRGQQKRRGK